MKQQHRKRDKYYRNKYALAIYDKEGENFIDIFDNIYDLNKWWGNKIEIARAAVTAIYHHKREHLIRNGVKYTLIIVPIDENEN